MLNNSEQQELSALEAEFGGLTPSENQEKIALEQSFENEGFFDRLGRDMQNRENIALDLYAKKQSGQISPVEYPFYMAGKVGAGIVGDIGGQAFKSGMNYIKDIDQFLGGYGGMATGEAVNKISSIPVGDKTLGARTRETLESAGGLYSRLPERGRLAIESAANLAMVGLPAAKWGDDVIEGTYKTFKSLRRPDIARMTPDELRITGGALFEKADRIGGGVKPEFWQEYVRRVQRNIAEPKDELIQSLNKVARKDNTVDDAFKAIMDVQESAQSYQAIRKSDEILGELANGQIDNMGRYTNEGRKLLGMQHTLRDLLDEAPESMFTGSGEAFDVANQAKRYWSASKRMEEVEKVIKRSKDARQPNTILKNGFRRIRDDKKLFKKFTPEEQFAIEKAAKTGNLEGFMYLQGSGLVPVIAGTVGMATGGPAGATAAIPAYIYQQGAKKIGEGLGERSAYNVLDTIQQTATGQLPTLPGMYAKQAAGGAAKSVMPISGVYGMRTESNTPLTDKARAYLQRKRGK